jgi:hypothetical protein
MKTIYKKEKRNYTKPQVEQVKIDNEISVFMTSSPEPPGDPVSIDPMNPFKLIKF